jgi:hypothetical protein
MYKLSPPSTKLDDNFIKESIKKNVEKEEVQMVDLINGEMAPIILRS